MDIICNFSTRLYLPPNKRWDRNGDCYDPGATTDPDLTEHSQLDHILLSANLWDRIVPDSATMMHDWSPACMKDGGLFSDHWPLMVNLNTEGGEVDVDVDDGDDDDDAAAKLERANTAITVLLTLMWVSIVIVFVVLARRLFKRSTAFARASMVDEDDTNTGVVMNSIHTERSEEEGKEF